MTAGTGGPPDAAGSVEQYADLHAYGLSLGVDIDADGEEDLQWVVSEAFNAPLPHSWTEYMDDSGRAYYLKEGSSQSTWQHPMDEVYRELLHLIKQVRSQSPEPTAAGRMDLVREHLKQVHRRAKNELAGWSGPYSSEQGDYYYNEVLKASTWECPVAEWETELKTRHAVLCRCLLPGSDAGLQDTLGETGAEPQGGDLLQVLRLQLGNLQREAEDVPFPSASRSFHTARSACSSRSGRSQYSKGSRHQGARSQAPASAHGLAPSEVPPPAAPAEYAPVD